MLIISKYKENLKFKYFLYKRKIRQRIIDDKYNGLDYSTVDFNNIINYEVDKLIKNKMHNIFIFVFITIILSIIINLFSSYLYDTIFNPKPLIDSLLPLRT